MITFISILHLVLFSIWGKHIYDVIHKGKTFDVFKEAPTNFATTLVMFTIVALIYWSFLILKYCP